MSVVRSLLNNGYYFIGGLLNMNERVLIKAIECIIHSCLLDKSHVGLESSHSSS